MRQRTTTKARRLRASFADARRRHQIECPEICEELPGPCTYELARAMWRVTQAQWRTLKQVLLITHDRLSDDAGTAGRVRNSPSGVRFRGIVLRFFTRRSPGRLGKSECQTAARPFVLEDMTVSGISAETRRALGIPPDNVVLAADFVAEERDGEMGAPRPAAVITVASLVANLVAGRAPDVTGTQFVSHSTQGLRLAVERYQDHWTIVDAEGRQLTVSAVGSAEKPVSGRSGQATVVALHLPVPAAATIEFPSGERWTLEPTERGVHDELTFPQPPREPKWGPSPVSDWCQQAEDPQVARWVREIPATGDGWDVLLAAGVIARHSRAPHPRTFEAMIEGTTGRVYRRWALGLDDDKRAYLTLYASEAAADLERELESLLDDALPFDDMWCSDLVAACRDRELLEGACAVLQSVGSGDILRRRLDMVDEMIPPFLSAFAPRPLDDVLGHVAELDPTVWWGRIMRAHRHHDEPDS